MRHFRQTHASYQCAKRKQKRTSVDIAVERLSVFPALRHPGGHRYIDNREVNTF
jgi:hypothetical protein